MSTNPGVTTRLVASITSLALPEKLPIAAIIPFLIAILPSFDLAPVPSTSAVSYTHLTLPTIYSV